SGPACDTRASIPARIPHIGAPPFPATLRPLRRLRRDRGGLEVLVEEIEDRLPALDLVFLLGEAVAFVREHDVLDRGAVLAGGGDDVVGLGLDDARVVGSLEDEERLPDPIGVEERRYREQHLAVLDRVAGLRVERLALRLPPFRDR